jgi:hypothetical protein
MATKAPLKATRGATTLQQLNVAFPRLGEWPQYYVIRMLAIFIISPGLHFNYEHKSLFVT